jgi:hypothetical protein
MRVELENPGGTRKKKRSRAMAKKKTARKRNPKRRRAKRAVNPPKRRRAKRANPPKRRRRRAAAVNPPRRRRASNPKRSRARRNPSRRSSKRNPGWANLGSAVKALLWGAGASILSSWVNDGPLGAQSEGVQNLALAAEFAGAVYYIDDPFALGGVVVGLGLVTAGNLIYGALPFLSAPTPMLVASSGPTMAALHQKNLMKTRKIDKGMAALHRGNMSGLHRAMGALHRGEDMGALMHHEAQQGRRQAFGRASARYGRQ